MIWTRYLLPWGVIYLAYLPESENPQIEVSGMDEVENYDFKSLTPISPLYYIQSYRPSQESEPCSKPFDGGRKLDHSGWVSVGLESNIYSNLKAQAEAVLREIGMDPREALELFYTQIVKCRTLPFPLEPTTPEDEVLSPTARRNALADA